MRLHVLQHVPFEGAANILKWAELKSHSITTTAFFEPGYALPGMADFDTLVVMGGPMGVHDEAEHPWLIQEKQFIRAAIDAGKGVIGICLGAQLAADVLGARVYPNAHREIGWFPVTKSDLPHPVLFDMDPTQMMFHWHGDTCDLPRGALLLAGSEACKHQAYMWNEQVLGLQFHLEMSPEHIETLIEHCFADLKSDSPYVQKQADIRKGCAAHAEVLPPLLDSVMTRFCS